MAEGKGTPTAEEGPNKRLPWWKRLWEWTEFGEKSGWEYLQLLGTLAIPVVIAVGTLWFTARQHEQQQLTEERRARVERELEDQRAQDAALQAYLDQMSTLLLEKDLRNCEANSKVRTLARARTATVIQRLDADTNRNVIRFLNEARLTGSNTGQCSISLLAQADLQGADFKGVDLSAIDLSDANLSDARLLGANLSDAKLLGADLGNADLGHANLSRAEGVTNEELEQARSLRGATMPDGQVLKSDDNPDGPAFEEWLKSEGRREDG